MWWIIKEVIGKCQKVQSLLPRKFIPSNIEIIKNKQITNGFNDCFTDIGRQLQPSKKYLRQLQFLCEILHYGKF